MNVAARSLEQNVLLREMSWAFYQSLLKELGDSPSTRVTYDNGLLQIMVISAAHDNPSRTIESIVVLVAAETGTDVCHLGSGTLQRPDLLKGFEPDSCFYFTHADAVRDKDDIDLEIDPAPELIVEVDVTSNSLNRFPIFAAVGVTEVWRYSNGIVTMYRLVNGEYHLIERSFFLPLLTPSIVAEFTASCRRTKWPVWVQRLRNWVHQADSQRN